MRRAAKKVRKPAAARAQWMEDDAQATLRPAGKTVQSKAAEGPDDEFMRMLAPVESPINRMLSDVASGKAHVGEAYLLEASVDADWRWGKRAKEGRKPYRIRRVSGTAKFKEALRESDRAQDLLGRRMREAARHDNPEDAMQAMQDKKLLESFDDGETSAQLGPYDPAQYTEFTPLVGGPYYKQLYLYDMLSMHAKAFEARNHNPLAKRIIDLLSQYAFGRRFKWRIKDSKKEKAWEEFAKQYNIVQRISKFWIGEYLTFGEIFVDKSRWQTLDPSSVWDIITDPDDITDVYYYHQSYSTPYTQFTGQRVKGVAGSEKVKAVEYFIKQLPYDQILHIKKNVTSFEKRGRSTLFPILGWLKRIKDLYDAEVVRAQLGASFIWDVEITGSQSDIDDYMSANSAMPRTGSTHYHNAAVKRAPMPAMPASTSTGQGGIGNEILAFIATGVGIPKDYFNVISTSGGNRATALVGAEPFTKVVEDLQADFEHLLLQIAEDVFERAGLGYQDGDVEFMFPSVTKDTTTETNKNIALGEIQGYIDHQTAAEMFAAEMNITKFDYEDTQKKIGKQAKQMPTLPTNPADRLGLDGGGSPIHGDGKEKTKDDLNSL